MLSLPGVSQITLRKTLHKPDFHFASWMEKFLNTCTISKHTVINNYLAKVDSFMIKISSLDKSGFGGALEEFFLFFVWPWARCCLAWCELCFGCDCVTELLHNLVDIDSITLLVSLGTRKYFSSTSVPGVCAVCQSAFRPPGLAYCSYLLSRDDSVSPPDCWYAL